MKGDFFVAIVEDTPSDSERMDQVLATFSEKTGFLFDVRHYSSGEAFLQDKGMNWSLIFMDIELPGITGLQAAEEIRKVNKDAYLIFTTNVASLAIAGYQYNAMDYLIKPINYDMVRPRLDKIANTLSFSRKTTCLSTKNGLKILSIHEILYIESFGHQIIYHTIDGDYETRGDSMKDLEKRFAEYSFARPNVSYLINLRYLDSIQENEVVLTNQVKLPISRNKKASFIEAVFSILHHNGGIL